MTESDAMSGAEASAEAPGYATHEVLNQPGALAGYNAFSSDTALRAAIDVFGADWARGLLERTGAPIGSERLQDLARQANRHLPELKTHDRFGNRVGEVRKDDREPEPEADVGGKSDIRSTGDETLDDENGRQHRNQLDHEHDRIADERPRIEFAE